MQVTKSLLIGMAALPWASTFGTMPKKKTKVDRLAGLEDVDTVSESADDGSDGFVNGNQVYIQIKGGQGTNGEAACAAQPAYTSESSVSTGGSGCYRSITTSETCQAAAEWFSSAAGKNYDADAEDAYTPRRGSFHDISGMTDDDGKAYDPSTLPADCYQLNNINAGATFVDNQPRAGKNQFYFNDGGASGWGIFDTSTEARSKLRYVCEYFCPPADAASCPDTGICYAAGRRDPAPSCSTYGNDGIDGNPPYRNSAECIGAQCTWSC